MANEKPEFPKTMYHPVHDPKIVTNSTEESQLGSGWSTSYIHKEFPKAMHHASEESVIVKTQEEQEALGEGWHEVRANAHGDNATRGDAKAVAVAPVREVGEKHLAYAQSQGWALLNVPALRKFLNNLKPEAEKAFMDEVDAWEDPDAEDEGGGEGEAGDGAEAGKKKVKKKAGAKAGE